MCETNGALVRDVDHHETADNEQHVGASRTEGK
jgi:hypothetical protein